MPPVGSHAHPHPQQPHTHNRGAASQSTITLAPYSDSAPNTPQTYDPRQHSKTAPALLVSQHAQPETGKIGEQKRTAAAASSILPANGRSVRATSVTKGPPPGVSVSVSGAEHTARPRSATTAALPVTPERERERAASAAVQNLSGTFDAVAGLHHGSGSGSNLGGHGHGGGSAGSGLSSGSNSGGPSPAGSPSPQPHSLTGAAPSFPTQHPPIQIRHRPSLALNPSHYATSGSGAGASNGADGAFSPGLVSPSPLSASFRGRSRACSVAVDHTSLANMTSEQKDVLIETQARELERAQDHLQKAGEYGSDLMMQLEELQSDKDELQEQLNMARAASYAAQSHGGNASSNGAQADASLLASFDAFCAFVRVELVQSNLPVSGEAAQDLAAFQRLLRSQRHAAREERAKAAAREEEASRLLANQRAQLNRFAQHQAEWTTQQTQLNQVQSLYDALEVHCAELQTKLRIQAAQAHTTGQVTQQQYETEREEWQNELDRTKEQARTESMKLRNAITNLRQQLAAALAKIPATAAAPSPSASTNSPLSATVVPAPASLLLSLEEGATEDETAEDSNDFKIVEPSPTAATSANAGTGSGASTHRRKASVSLADDLETAPTEPPSPSLSARPSPRSRAPSVIAAMPPVPEVSTSGGGSGQVLGSDAEADVAVAGGVLAATSQGGLNVSDLSASLTALQVQLALAKEAAALLIASERDRQSQRDSWHAAEEQWQFERARVREAEQQAQTMRLEELARERALQAEVTEGRSYEATIAALRNQLREAREEREDSAVALAEAMRALMRQVAEQEHEITSLREQIDAQPAALTAAVSAATLKISQHHAAAAAGHWTPPPYRSSGPGGNESNSSSNSVHAQQHQPESSSSSSSSHLHLPPPALQPQPQALVAPPSTLPLTFGPSSAITAPTAATAATPKPSPSSSLGKALPVSTTEANALVIPAASKGALQSDTSVVLRAVHGGNRTTRWFLLLLFLLQLLMVACWLVLTHGGSAGLADHPFAQSMMRSLLGEEARTLRYS